MGVRHLRAAWIVLRHPRLLMPYSTRPDRRLKCTCCVEFMTRGKPLMMHSLMFCTHMDRLDQANCACSWLAAVILGSYCSLNSKMF